MLLKITALGTLGNDPELRYTSSGTAVTNFGMATTQTISKMNNGQPRNQPEGWKESQNGRNFELTTWIRVTVWGAQAESVATYLKKGRQAYVEGTMAGEAIDGTLNPKVWEDSNGVARASFEVTARTVIFLGGAQAASDEPEPVPGFDD